VRIWGPEKDEAAITDAVTGPDYDEPALPEQPPQGARRVSPLNAERRTVMFRSVAVVVFVSSSLAGAAEIVDMPQQYVIPKPDKPVTVDGKLDGWDMADTPYYLEPRLIRGPVVVQTPRSAGTKCVPPLPATDKVLPVSRTDDFEVNGPGETPAYP
jgi:hypothetical protein